MSNTFPTLGPWTEAHFDSLSWHDCPIHGMRFEHGPEAWESHLILDIDHMAEWIRPAKAGDGYSFRIAPADWVFEHIEDLRIDIGPSLYAGPFTISQVTRESVTPRPGCTAWKWTITLDCPSSSKNLGSFGSIQLLSQTMGLRHRKPVIVQDRQVLPKDLRF